jgi:hypothetical protein
LRLETTHSEWFVVLFADSPVRLSAQRTVCLCLRRTYRMDGGVPAGIFSMPLVSGDLMKSTRINPITRQGKRSTRPKGIEMEEPPFNRMRRPKTPSRGEVFSARLGKSSSLSMMSGEGFIFLATSWMNPIGAQCRPVTPVSVSGAVFRCASPPMCADNVT